MQKWMVAMSLTFVFLSNATSADLSNTSINQLHQSLSNKKITCEQVINQYLDRIQKYNIGMSDKAPFNAFTEINPLVREQARNLDQYFAKTGQFKGVLHCVPVAVKDNIDTYELTSAAGSLALLGNQPQQDAWLVQQMRQQGALIIGKTGMDELAAGLSGISSRSGRIGNAFDTNQNPGGSSGGSAVAVSANFALLAIGSDNSGSIRIPAAFNGIVGLRPSMGLISQQGMFPAGNLDGTAGPIARTVTDLALLLNVIPKQDKKIKVASVPKDYSSFLNKNGLQGKRIGIVRTVGDVKTYKGMPQSIKDTLEHALQQFEKSGAVIVKNIKLPKFITDRRCNMSGMKEDVDEYPKSYPAVRKNINDICLSNRSRAYGDVHQCLKFIKGMPMRNGNLYNKALSNFQFNKEYVHQLMQEKQLDALFIPISTQGIATYDPMQVNTWQAPVASNAGLPAISLNLGYQPVSGMPIGVELVGKQFAEGTLIEIAYAFEQQSPASKTPNMPLPNVRLAQLSISAYNNLLTRIGYQSYQSILKDAHKDLLSDDLTASKFNQMLQNEIRR